MKDHTTYRTGGWMYIFECADGSFYTGSTKDLSRRLIQHQSGEGANHTRKRLPVKLVYFETYDRIDQAFYREKQIQKWSRKKKQALIEGRIEDLKKLAECRNGSHWKNAPLDSAPLDSAPLDSARGAGVVGRSNPVVERSRETTAENFPKTNPVVERSRETTAENFPKTNPVVERSRNDRRPKVRKNG